MFITKKHLSRRTLLKGGSAAIGLPLLSAMVPAATALAQTAAAAKPRMGFFYLPHGAIMNNTRFGADANAWTPDIEGRDFDFTMILKPLEPFRDHLTVVTQTDLRAAEAWTAAEEGADHFRSSAVFLTAAHPKQTEGSDVAAGTSIELRMYGTRIRTSCDGLVIEIRAGRVWGVANG